MDLKNLKYRSKVEIGFLDNVLFCEMNSDEVVLVEEKTGKEHRIKKQTFIKHGKIIKNG